MFLEKVNLTAVHLTHHSIASQSLKNLDHSHVCWILLSLSWPAVSTEILQLIFLFVTTRKRKAFCDLLTFWASRKHCCMFVRNLILCFHKRSRNHWHILSYRLRSHAGVWEHKVESKCLPVASHTLLLFPALHPEQSTRWFNLFTSTCSHCCVCCSLVDFLNCSPLASHCLLCLVCFSQNVPSLCFFLVSFFFWFSFLKLHKGTRTHAQLPRRPVPPPKPRRSKKGVSRCSLWPLVFLYSPLWFASLSLIKLLLLHLLLFTQWQY